MQDFVVIGQICKFCKSGDGRGKFTALVIRQWKEIKLDRQGICHNTSGHYIIFTHSLTVDKILHITIKQQQTATYQNAASSSGRHMWTSCLISSLVFILNSITMFNNQLIYNVFNFSNNINHTIIPSTSVLKCCTDKITASQRCKLSGNIFAATVGSLETGNAIP